MLPVGDGRGGQYRGPARRRRSARLTWPAASIDTVAASCSTARPEARATGGVESVGGDASRWRRPRPVNIEALRIGDDRRG